MKARSVPFLSHRPAILALFLTFSAVYFVYMGNVKNYQGFVWDYDTRCWYTAGICWWNGDSPYDPARYTEVWTDLFGEPPRNKATFVYPPTMALISLPLALLPWSLAAWAFRLASLLAVFGIGYFSWKLMETPDGERPYQQPSGWYWGLCAYLASVTQCLTQGQCALIVVCGCLAAWYGFRTRRWPLFLAGFLVACIKPQISLLPLVFILASGGVAWFLAGASLTVGFMALILVAFPETRIFQEYDTALENHMTYQEFNRWSRYCGVPALLGFTPFGKAAAIAGVALGLAGVAWLGARARRLPDTIHNDLRHGQLVWVAAFAAMPIHIYDLTGQLFVTLTLWIWGDWRIRAAAFGTMVLADRMPVLARIAGKVGGPDLNLEALLLQVGTPLCSAALLVVLCWAYRRERPAMKTA